MQSMTAFSKRLDHLSGRISSVAQLQRSQTELSLQKQNRDLLTSMNERTFAQLRLQQTVEGLSLAAITYYGVGLVGYIAASVPMGVSATVIKSLSVPVIALAAYLVIARAPRVGRGDSPRLKAQKAPIVESNPQAPSKIIRAVKLAPLSIIMPMMIGAPALAITLIGNVTALIAPK